MPRLAVLGVAVLVAAGLAGCSSGTDEPASDQPLSPSGSTSTPAPTPTGDPVRFGGGGATFTSCVNVDSAGPWLSWTWPGSTAR